MFVRQFGFPLVILITVVNIAILCTMACNPALARKYPMNYYLLGGFTVCEGL